MLYHSKYAVALRCVGQVLQQNNIEVFELTSEPNEFYVQGGAPEPPFTSLIQISFSLARIAVLDREGRAKRGQSDGTVRFDSLAEVLRSVGEYVDQKLGNLRRINNCDSTWDASLEIEYVTRGGHIQLEKLPISFLRETSVRMYKRRMESIEPVSILRRRP